MGGIKVFINGQQETQANAAQSQTGSQFRLEDSTRFAAENERKD